MNPRIEKIRQLLSELEAESTTAPRGDLGFSALELPEIIGEIVDDLQPILTAYDAAFYWFLFRHSIAKDGNPQIRVSRSTLRRAVVKSSYIDAEENMISFGKVQDTLRALEEIGAIQKLGEPNRQGTLYRVLIPDEIFIHTIMGNSPFPIAAGRNNPHYIRWTVGPHPDVLSEKDLPALRESEKLFARKFEWSREARLLDRVDRECAKRICEFSRRFE